MIVLSKVSDRLYNVLSKVSDRLYAWARWRLILAVFVMFLLLMLSTDVLTAFLIPVLGTTVTLDGLFFYTPETAFSVVASFSRSFAVPDVRTSGTVRLCKSRDAGCCGPTWDESRRTFLRTMAEYLCIRE